MSAKKEMKQLRSMIKPLEKANALMAVSKSSDRILSASALDKSE